jgi:hypothetical protein
MEDHPWLRGLQGVHNREAAAGGTPGSILVGHWKPEAREQAGVGALHDGAPEPVIESSHDS